MNAEKLHQLFEHPEELNEAQLASLKEAIADFPYSAPLHALYMKALQQGQSYLLPNQIKRTAISVPNRALLKQWYELEASEKPTKGPKIVFDVEALKQPEVVKEVEAAKESSVEKEPAVAEVVEVVVAPKEEPKETVAPKPAELRAEKPVTSTSAANEPDLSKLPEAVRNAILRSRALRGEATNESSVVSETAAESKAAKKPAIAPEPAVEKEIVKEVQPIVDAARTFEVELPVTEVELGTEKDTEEAEVQPVAEEPAWEEPEVRHMPFSEKATFLQWLNADHIPAPTGSKDPVSVEPVMPPKRAKERLDVGKIIGDLPKFDVPKRGEGINVFRMEADQKGKFVTETLAEIYLNQGLLDKAISAYEVLSLKYPEKSGFFADRIRDIKKQQK